MTLESDPRWQRVLSRDPNADGTFWFAVSTTKGVLPPVVPGAPR